MLHRLAFASLLSAALVAPALGDTTVVFEDFESYTSSADLLAAWPSSDPTRPDNGTQLVMGDTVPFYGGTNLTNFGQFCGSANDAAGLANCGTGPGGGTVNIWDTTSNSPTAFQIAPSATQNVELTVDIGDDALSANKRLSVGLRSVTPTAENLIELGFYNSVSTTNIPHFAYRAVLFASGNLPGTASWGSFSDDAIDQPLPDTLDSPGEVGAGFHRFKAVISLNQVVFSLDLYGDGKTNDPVNPVPGEGTDGVDAFDITDATVTANGFNQLRFGTPSALPSSGGTNINAAFAAFDNISLKLVDIQAPAGDADFDGDGDVDGRDFLIWQRGVGTPDALPADGDADLDMDVDGDDLVVWQNQYGPGALASVAAVPEPGTGLLLVAASALLAVRRR